MLLVQIALAIFVPFYIWTRAQAAGSSIALNFCLYPLVFSYFYLLLPSFLQDDNVAALVFRISPSARQSVDWLSIWAVFVFLAVYHLGKDKDRLLLADLRISQSTRLVTRGIRYVISLSMTGILITHGPSLYAAGSRGASYAIYEQLLDQFKLPLLFALALTSSIIGFLQNRRLLNFTPLTLFCFLDVLAGGRGYLFSSLLAIYLTYTARNSAPFKLVTVGFITMAAAVFVTAYYRRIEDGLDPIFILFGEFYATRLTAQFTFDNFYAAGDILNYIVTFLSRFAPQFLLAPFLEGAIDPSYAVILNNNTGLTYGLAGSLLSEALYYGGEIFGFIYPLLMALTYLCMQRSNLILSLPGYVFFILLAASTFNIFRGSFFLTWATLVYMTIFYLCPVMLKDLKKKVFVRGASLP